jgi:integrase
MSSTSTYKSKHGDTLRAIQFVGVDRKRRSIRLGTRPASDVDAIKQRIDLLEVYRKHNRAPDIDTANWLGRLESGIYDQLAKGGLVEPRPGTETRKGISLGAFLENYIGQRQALVKAGKLEACSLRLEVVTRDSLVQQFGADKLLGHFTESDAEDFRHYLLTVGGQPTKRYGSGSSIRARTPLAESTTRKRCSVANKFFRAAVRRGHITRNPFDTQAVPKANIATSRHAYIKAADARAVMDKLPGTQWELMFALLRWGGLRIGELRLLTWADVLWDEEQLLVHSPKTKRYEGHESRKVPFFLSDSPLAELLSRRYEEATEGEQYVLPMFQGRTDSSRRDVIQRAIEAAGVTPWPRLFHNLRGTRENELLEAGRKPEAVYYWLGNSSATARKHYVKVTEADLQQANAPHSSPTAPLTAPLEKNARGARR